MACLNSVNVLDTYVASSAGLCVCTVASNGGVYFLPGACIDTRVRVTFKLRQLLGILGRYVAQAVQQVDGECCSCRAVGRAGSTRSLAVALPS